MRSAPPVLTARTPLLLATRNRGKLRELQPLFAEWGVPVATLDDVGLIEVPAEADLESFPTFAENAMAKARFFHAQHGGLVLAEDSGLCVDALAGAPGVHSKRWGAADAPEGVPLEASNIALLLDRLSGVTARDAQYRCSAALVWDGGTLVADGETRGRILEVATGEGGFGYDPVFWSSELRACFANVSRASKAAVSHRSRAVALLWQAYRGGGMPVASGPKAVNSECPVDRSRGPM